VRTLVRLVVGQFERLRFSHEVRAAAADDGAAVPMVGDGQLSPDDVRAVPHRAESEPGFRRTLGRQAAAIVVHAEPNDVLVHRHLHRDASGATVAHRVAERFLHDAEQMVGGAFVDPQRDLRTRSQGDRQAVGFPGPRGEGAQRRDQSASLQ
jgi:hypothetical protein